MPKILDNRTTLDKTVKIFDDFYNFKLIINGDQYDIVYSYFKSVQENSKIAANFTVFLFRIAQETNTNVLDLLNFIKGLNNKLEMNKTIVYYLNSFKSKTSLYGIGLVPTSNQFAQRNVVQ